VVSSFRLNVLIGVYVVIKSMYDLYKHRRSSDHNNSVQQRIVKEILDQADCKFSESIVKGIIDCSCGFSLYYPCPVQLRLRDAMKMSAGLSTSSSLEDKNFPNNNLSGGSTDHADKG
jgi:hypothetical protein